MFLTTCSTGDSGTPAAEGGEAARGNERQGEPDEAFGGPPHGAGEGAGQQPSVGAETAARPEPANVIA